MLLLGRCFHTLMNASFSSPINVRSHNNCIKARHGHCASEDVGLPNSDNIMIGYYVISFPFVALTMWVCTSWRLEANVCIRLPRLFVCAYVGHVWKSTAYPILSRIGKQSSRWWKDFYEMIGPSTILCVGSLVDYFLKYSSHMLFSFFV